MIRHETTYATLVTAADIRRDYGRDYLDLLIQMAAREDGRRAVSTSSTAALPRQYSITCGREDGGWFVELATPQLASARDGDDPWSVTCRPRCQFLGVTHRHDRVSAISLDALRRDLAAARAA